MERGKKNKNVNEEDSVEGSERRKKGNKTRTEGTEGELLFRCRFVVVVCGKQDGQDQCREKRSVVSGGLPAAPKTR